MKEEEVVETTEETTLRSLSWTWQMNARMSSKTNTFVLMQKCKIFNAVPMKNVKTCNAIVAKIWQKAILPSLDNLERALAVEGLTDDVKKGIEMVQESLIHALKEEGIEEISS